MKIRKFKPADARQVSKVMNDSFSAFLGKKLNAFDRKSFSPEVLKKISHEKGFDGKSYSFVAEEQGQILGYIRGIVKVYGLSSLEVIGISPDAFGKGTGTALLEKLEAVCRRYRCRKIATCVAAHNTRALIYYLKNGFIPEGYQKDHFKVGVDEIILGKFLKYES